LIVSHVTAITSLKLKKCYNKKREWEIISIDNCRIIQLPATASRLSKNVINSY
jgi:hypothetical protein